MEKMASDADLDGAVHSYYIGHLDGMKRAYKTQGWDNVTQWFGEDPEGTEVALIALALEELIRE